MNNTFTEIIGKTIICNASNKKKRKRKCYWGQKGGIYICSNYSKYFNSVTNTLLTCWEVQISRSKIVTHSPSKLGCLAITNS